MTDHQHKILLSLARKVITNGLSGWYGAHAWQKEKDPTSEFLEKRGTFVTLNLEENLRGCIGIIIPYESIWESVQHNAIQAAFHDPRFSPVSKEELDSLVIEISILSSLQKQTISNEEALIHQITPYTDGVLLRYQGSSATFLPQVWAQLPNHKGFFSALAEKAGLSIDIWKKLDKIEIFTYQVEHFAEL